MQRLAGLAAAGNVAIRIDAIGTIFGDWALCPIRPWLLEVTGTFGPQRCMLGSDLPIENPRSGFGPLYAAYDSMASPTISEPCCSTAPRSAGMPSPTADVP